MSFTWSGKNHYRWHCAFIHLIGSCTPDRRHPGMRPTGDFCRWVVRS